MRPGTAAGQVAAALSGALSALKGYTASLPGCELLLASRSELRLSTALPAIAGAMQRIIR